MKSFVTAAALAALASADGLLFNSTMFEESDAMPQGSIKRNEFGMLVEEMIYELENHVHKKISPPLEPYAHDTAHQVEHIQKMTDLHDKILNDEVPIYTCTNRETNYDPKNAGSFFPVLSAALTMDNATGSYEGSCFQQIDFSLSKTSDTTFDVDVTHKGKKKMLCEETMLFANTEMQHFETFMFPGTTKLSFTLKDQDAVTDFNFGGIKVFDICDGYKDLLVSVLKFLEAFAGGFKDNDLPIIGRRIPKYQLKQNLVFLKQTMDLDIEPREITKVEIDPDLIQSGDFLAVNRMDGLDPLIMYGTGSMIGHSCMALRMDGELYIVESYGGDFRPNKGIIRTKWADWIHQLEISDCWVSWLPLREEIREKFNEEAAIEFFNQTQGLPYGIHNFLYGWIDTATDNWPPLLAQHIVPILFKVYEDLTYQGAYNIFTEGINKRLGTEHKSVSEVAAIAAEQGMTLQDVMAMVEMDGWIYDGQVPRDGLSFVCSAYVAAMYKHAGLFDDLDVQSVEFTPKDIYTLNFFQSGSRPQACVDADPDLEWCQLLGSHRMPLFYFNTVTPYAHMNEKCPVNWPTYAREEGC